MHFSIFLFLTNTSLIKFFSMKHLMYNKPRPKENVYNKTPQFIINITGSWTTLGNATVDKTIVRGRTINEYTMFSINEKVFKAKPWSILWDLCELFCLLWLIFILFIYYSLSTRLVCHKFTPITKLRLNGP